MDNITHPPIIPKFVADYISWAKLQDNFSLKDLLNFRTQLSIDAIYSVPAIKELSEYVHDNSEILARAWIYGYKVQARNYITVEHEMDWYEDSIENLGFGVEFIGQKPEGYETFDTLQNLYKTENGTNLTMEDALCNMYSKKEQGEIYQEFIDFFPFYKKELRDFDDVARELTYELFEYMIQDIANLKELIESNDFQIGTVGRSNWTYYIMHKKHTNYNLPLDLWEGYNFYTISVMDTDEDGLFLGYSESVHHVYAPNINDIFLVIYDHFGIIKNDIYLLENDITQHLLDIDKVIKRTVVYYEPKDKKY